MKWTHKVRIQRSLAFLPPAVGDPLYHRLQMIHGLKPEIRENDEFLAEVEKRLVNGNRPGVEGRTIVELGSGWYPALPFLLLARGAKAVITADLNEHYTPKRISEAAQAVLSYVKSNRAIAVLEQAGSTGRLPEQVRYYPRTGIQSVSAESLTGADLALSRYVLEHVRPEDMIEIHASSRRWLRPEGLWIHLVSPSDHRAYDDKSLHLVDFLRFSQPEWDRLGGNRYNYHNRLRLPHYRELFAKSGWKIVLEESTVVPETLADLGKVPLHPDFRDMAPEDLVAGGLWFVLERA
jgi:hypothetical protein